MIMVGVHCPSLLVEVSWGFILMSMIPASVSVNVISAAILRRGCVPWRSLAVVSLIVPTPPFVGDVPRAV